MAKYNGSGWHKESVRHSRARKYGKAGGIYVPKLKGFKQERVGKHEINFYTKTRDIDLLKTGKNSYNVIVFDSKVKDPEKALRENESGLFETLPEAIKFIEKKRSKGKKHYGVPDEEHWVEAVLKNDEGSSDQELVDYFMKEGSMSKEKAQFYVDQRQRLTLKPLKEDLVPYKSKEEQEREASLYEGEARGYFTKKQVEKLLKHGELLGETKKNYGKSEDEEILKEKSQKKKR